MKYFNKSAKAHIVGRSLRRRETARLLSPNASMNKTSSPETEGTQNRNAERLLSEAVLKKKELSEVELIVMLLITVKCTRLDRKEIA